MSELWETVPVSRKVREALWKWAEWALDETADPFAAPDLHAAARQFREDVLAAKGDRAQVCFLCGKGIHESYFEIDGCGRFHHTKCLESEGDSADSRAKIREKP